MVGAEGFEPPTLWSQTRCATRLRYAPTASRLNHLVLFTHAFAPSVQTSVLRRPLLYRPNRCLAPTTTKPASTSGTIISKASTTHIPARNSHPLRLCWPGSRIELSSSL